MRYRTAFSFNRYAECNNRRRPQAKKRSHVHCTKTNKNNTHACVREQVRTTTPSKRYRCLCLFIFSCPPKEGLLWGAELVHEDSGCVGSSHSVHAVENKVEVRAGNECFEARKVEHRLQQHDILLRPIHVTTSTAGGGNGNLYIRKDRFYGGKQDRALMKPYDVDGSDYYSRSHSRDGRRSIPDKTGSKAGVLSRRPSKISTKILSK